MHDKYDYRIYSLGCISESVILSNSLDSYLCNSDGLFFPLKSLQSVSVICFIPWGSKSVSAILKNSLRMQSVCTNCGGDRTL